MPQHGKNILKLLRLLSRRYRLMGRGCLGGRGGRRDTCAAASTARGAAIRVASTATTSIAGAPTDAATAFELGLKVCPDHFLRELAAATATATRTTTDGDATVTTFFSGTMRVRVGRVAVVAVPAALTGSGRSRRNGRLLGVTTTTNHGSNSRANGTC